MDRIKKIKTLDLSSNTYRNSTHITQNGITLVALVITIIILLILAGVTIATLMSDDGIFEKAENAAYETRKARFEERIGLVNLDAQSQKVLTGNLTPEDYFDIVKDHGLISDSTIGGDNIEEKGENEEGNKVYEVTTEEGDVFEVTIDDEGNVKIEYQGTVDGLPPRISEIETSKTTNSITVKVTVNRLESGDLKYYIKKASDENYPTEPEKTTKDTNYTFTKLEQNVTYDIKVVAENNKGEDEYETSEITGELATGAVTQKGETVWNNGEASIELETTETGYTIQYQKNGTQGSWQEYTGPITGLHNNDKIFVRLWDGTNASGETAITITDGVAPTVTVTVSKGTVTTSSIQVTASATDEQSGMPSSPTYNYYIKTANGSYPDTANHTGTETSYTFTGLSQNTSYEIKVTVSDNAGNVGEGKVSGTTAEVGGATEGLQTGNITVGETTWSNNKASITLSTSTNFAIQYKIGSSGAWAPASYTSTAAGQDVQVTGLSHNTIVYARLLDNANNAGSEASVTITDGIKPTVTVTKGTVNAKSIQVRVGSSDNQSGMANTPTYSYYIKTANGNYPGTANHTGTETSYTFSNLAQNTNYNIKVTVADKAGNVGEKIITIKTTIPSTVAEAKGATEFTATKEITDGQGNRIKIPGGFKVSSDSAVNVQGGIVIQDNNGNQFVWIPVGSYQTTQGSKTNNLSRRTFTSSGATEVNGDSPIESFYYGEGYSNSSVAYTTIGPFKNNATSNGGFYIGRYEQGTGNVCKAGVVPYVYITRDEAKSEAEAMYNGNTYVKSELISSYAWDTALNFICQNSTYGYILATVMDDQNYANLGTGKRENTGQYKADCYSNIHDFLGNCFEWSTEISTRYDSPCTYRGADHYWTDTYAAHRMSDPVDAEYYGHSFRVQLYVK